MKYFYKKINPNQTKQQQNIKTTKWMKHKYIITHLYKKNIFQWRNTNLVFLTQAINHGDNNKYIFKVEKNGRKSRITKIFFNFQM